MVSQIQVQARGTRNYSGSAAARGTNLFRPGALSGLARESQTARRRGRLALRHTRETGEFLLELEHRTKQVAQLLDSLQYLVRFKHQQGRVLLLQRPFYFFPSDRS